YPTEALFVALLESFRYVPEDAGDPIAAFARGELAWTPAPYDVAIERGGIWVQRRARIEKIVVGGRAYYRPDWQGVRRLAPRAVRDVGDTVRASLVALGRVLEDHLVLPADGGVIAAPAPRADPPESAPLPPRGGAPRPLASPTAAAQPPRQRSPRRPPTCRPPRSRPPDRRRPTRARSPPRRKRSREKPRESNRGAPRLSRAATNAGEVGRAMSW